MPQTTEQLDQSFINRMKRMSKKELAQIERKIKTRFDLTVLEICKEHRIGTNYTKRLHEYFGIDTNWRQEKVRRFKAIKALKSHCDLDQLHYQVRKGLINSTQARAQFKLNWAQWLLALELADLTPAAASEILRNSTRCSAADSTWMEKESLSGDGMSLEWLCKKW